MTSARIAGLQGLWRRSLITWPRREASDTTTSVRWLQGPRAYIDLRQPTPMPDFSHARSLEDLTFDDCAWLARQEGFAGYLHFDGEYFEWVREIDFQPRSPSADAGSLRWEGGVLIETGRDADYIEHWHRDPSIPTTPADTVALQGAAHKTRATLLRVGPHFMFARARATSLEKSYGSLAEYVAAAPDLAHARELIDCEISFGEVAESGLRITASTLPYRIGALMELE
jgi:allophanate hydrolase